MMNPQTVTLEHPSGCTASILAGFGLNCFSLQTIHDGRLLDVLWAEDEFATGQRRPSGSGIPILFPFPGRIRGTALNYEGRSYLLVEGDGQGNAIHGFVLDRPWRVIEQSATDLTAQFQASLDDPSLLDCWPADFRIEVRFTLQQNALQIATRVEALDGPPLPFGLGLHPYFRVPLGGPDADACTIHIPAAKYWELVDMSATGRRLPATEHGSPADGIAFGESRFDDVFTELSHTDGRCECRIIDPGSGRKLTVAFDSAFRECVVYNPPHRQAICIEPYTCVPDALRLEASGIDAGLRRLSAGETFEAAVAISVE